MRKLISAVLVAAMVSTPCLAQTQVEPDSTISIEGTLWQCTVLWPPLQSSDRYLGFYGGKVYTSSSEGSTDFHRWDGSFYVDLVVTSIYSITDKETGVTAIELGSMSPLLGIGSSTIFSTIIFLFVLSVKVNDDWAPTTPYTQSNENIFGFETDS